MENFGKLMAVLMLLACGVLLQLFVTHVILSISGLYGLTFITQFSFVQIFGTLIVISIVRHRYTKLEKKDLGDTFLEGTTGLLTNLLTYLFVWGMAFLTYHIIF